MRSINRRDLLKVSAGAGAAGMLARAGMPAAFAQDAVTLRVGSWDGVDSEPIQNAVVAAFNETNPNIKVQFEFNPDAYDEKMLTGLAAGNAPDVFLWWNYPSLVSRKGLTNLSPLATGAAPVDLGIYYPQVMTYNSVGGNVYGLPKDFTPRAYFYNKKLLDDAGIAYPTNDWTWDDLQQMAVALTKGEGADKQFGFYTYSGNYPLQGYVWSNGGDFISPDGTTADGFLNSDATLSALDWYIKLQTDLKVAPTQTEEATVGGAADLFQNGKLAIYDNGRWPQSQFKSVPDLDFGTVLPPKSPTGSLVTVLHASGWCLNPDSDHPDEAWTLIKGLADAQSQQIVAESGWALPAIPSVTQELGLLDDPIEKTWFEAVDFATVAACFLRTPNWDRAASEIDQAISSAFLGEASIQDAIDNAMPAVNKALEG